jgi:outer membrane murein-binding lipoprotein Lpp
MVMHNVATFEVNDLSTKVKAASATVEKLESKLGRQATDIAKLQQDMKTALKGK